MNTLTYGLLVGTAVIGLTFAPTTVLAMDEPAQEEKMTEEMRAALQAEASVEAKADNTGVVVETSAKITENAPEVIETNENTDETSAEPAENMTDSTDEMAEDDAEYASETEEETTEETMEEEAGEEEVEAEKPAEPVEFEGDKENPAAEGKRWWGRPY